MKRSTLLSILVLISMVLALVPAPMAAQEGNAPEHLRAPRPADSQAAAPAPLRPEWGGAWQYGTPPALQRTRFDAGYYPGDGLVYFMGGRLPDNNTDGRVWSWNPVTDVYTDMGVDLVAPISNYTMNLLQDGSGNWGFYVFCGRLSDGSNNFSVQVYYPDTNTTAELDAADNFPGAIACTSGLNVVYNNKVYIAGGFDGAANHAETWVFDPTAAVGSKWTQLTSATLATARAYIMGAVVNDLIYAIGGSYYDGAALVNVQTVEVLDPNAATPVWDDASVADLPVQCSESRAWGFDSDSPYVDPDGTPLANKIVSGCGFWSAQVPDVYVYNTTLNYWEAFPFFNAARRSQAGELIPSTRQLRVWGGYGGEATTEYYGLNLAGACSILLVDDDWDFDQTVPNDGGRPYYTSTLEALALPYDLWDTVSQGTPTTADLDPYDVVIWFTGYDWIDPISPTLEMPEILAYLDNGGSLLMSSQEQEYAYPGSTIMSTYFWVDSVIEDVTELDVEGGAADPLFAGLGPYNLGRPDQWAAYWPTGQYEGPYDDEVHVKAGGFEPLFYATAGTPNSTRFDSGTFKTIYLGWPFEWLPDLADREAVLSTALGFLCPAGLQPEFLLIPPGQVGSGAPEAEVPYTLTLVNNLGDAETFDLTYDSIWPIDGPPVIGPVVDGASESFVVTVTVPADANCYDVDTAAVTATAQSDLAEKTAYLETTADPPGVGDITGVVYDANTSLGIPDAYVYLELGDHYYEGWANGSGAYTLPNVPTCVYSGGANAVGYFNDYFGATPPATLDIYLDAADPALAPKSVSVNVPVDGTGTYHLNLVNHGTGNLNFHVSEVNSASIYPIPDAGNRAPLPSGIDPQVYADLAASPQGTARFIVYLAEQADLSAAFGIRDWTARGQYVLNALRATAERSQAALRADLDRAGVRYEPRYIVNALAVEGNLALADSLIARPEVAFIGPDQVIAAPEPVEMGPAVDGGDAPVWNVAQINADDVWTTFGVTGTGIVVSNIDTGVQYTHTALVEAYRGNEGGGNFDHNYNWWDPYGDQPYAPYDYHSHGSHTTGTMVGGDLGGQEIGIAPGGQWIACNGFKQGGSGYSVELLECAEFLLAPWDLTGANANPALRPHVINNSWGGGGADWWYNQAIYAWRAAGIIGIFSAGNAGPSCETIGAPDYANVMLVGATNNADVIASFSSRGPTDIAGLRKPDVSAPGVGVISAYNNGNLGSMSGTSMAAPHVSGLAALLWSAVPELQGDIQLTYWIIEQSAMPITTTEGCGGDLPTDIPNHTYGWGRIDALQAVSLALSSAWDIGWLDMDPVSGEVLPSGTISIELSFDATGLTVGECYTGTLKIEYNDPYVIEEFVPVEMCVVKALQRIYLPLIVKGN